MDLMDPMMDNMDQIVDPIYPNVDLKNESYGSNNQKDGSQRYKLLSPWILNMDPVVPKHGSKVWIYLDRKCGSIILVL